MADDSQKILRLVVDRGMIRGFELKRESGLESKAFVDAVLPLLRGRAITASEPVRADNIDRVQFAPLSGSLAQLA